MGWKSTLVLTREEAINKIIYYIESGKLEDLNNEELSLFMDGMGEISNTGLYGSNFTIVDTQEEKY